MSTAFVASPIKTGNTPVAIGSSVPECPMRRVAHIPLNFATTSNDVKPSGLFIIKIPVIFS